MTSTIDQSRSRDLMSCELPSEMSSGMSNEKLNV